MDDRLNDIRILHLARGMEASIEAFQAGLAKHIDDAVAREAAEQAQAEGPAHEALHAAYDDLNQEIANHPFPPENLALLTTLLEGEQQARSFYIEWKDRLRNPRLQELFARLALEEQGHVELIGAQVARLQANGQF